MKDVVDSQTRIWYIDFLNLWLTTDSTYVINVWDLEKEALALTISSPLIKTHIIDIVPLETSRLVAVSSFDRMVTLWNFLDQKILMKLDFSIGGIHTMLWSNNYQVLVTAGYENIVKIWTINSSDLEHTLIGKLAGHPTAVTAVELIDKTPMIVTSDDCGRIKVWDIRNLTCLQTLELETKATISRLIGIYQYGKLGFVGSRINLLEFEDGYSMLNPQKENEQLWPIKAEYDIVGDQFIICTRKDVRFIDAQVGRVKKVYAGLLPNNEDDISTFKLFQQSKKFVIGDDRGHICLYSADTGQLIKKLISHTNEVTSIQIDNVNKCIISGSADSKVFIQQENKKGYEILRSISNVHFNRGVFLMEVSVHHNLIITATNNSSFYIWDYEQAKLIGHVKTKESSEPTCISYIQGYGVIVIADSFGKIHFLHVRRKGNLNIALTKIGEIDIHHSSESTHVFVSKLLIDFHQENEDEEVKDVRLYVSTNKGVVKIYEITHVVQQKGIKVVQHANTRPNYNCGRKVVEDFLMAVHYHTICEFDLSAPPQESLAPTFFKEFKAHNDNLTSLSKGFFPVKRLMTTSLDCYLKIWTLDGVLLSALNINHPLPITWDLTLMTSNKYKKKILYALKVLDGILQKFKGDMFIEEEKKISANQFLKKLASPTPQITVSAATMTDIPAEAGFFMTEVDDNKKKKKVILMKDEYTARDFQFEKAKHLFQKELQGPSLRQMDVVKRMAQAQRAAAEMTKYYKKKVEDEEEQAQKQFEEEKAMQQFLNFLTQDGPSGSEHALLKQQDYSPEVKQFANRLELSLYDKKFAAGKSIREIKDSTSPKSILTSLQKNRMSRLRDISPPVHALSTTCTNLDTKIPNAKSRLDFSKDDGNASPLHPAMISPKSRTSLLLQHSARSSNLGIRVNKSPQNFYRYARTRLNTTTPDEDLSFPSLSASRGGPYEEQKSAGYLRKEQKKHFATILTKLDEEKKRSLYRPMGSDKLKFIKAKKVKNTPVVHQLPSTKAILNSTERTEKNSSLLSFEDFVETQKIAKGYTSFTEGLKNFHGYIKEAWKPELDKEKEREAQKQGKFFKKVMNKIHLTKNVSNIMTNQATSQSPIYVSESVRSFVPLDSISNLAPMVKEALSKSKSEAWKSRQNLNKSSKNLTKDSEAEVENSPAVTLTDVLK